MSSRADEPELTAGTRLICAALSLGAAAIHFSVIQAHLDEGLIFGIFFAAVAFLQVAWALSVVLSPDRTLALAGAWGNAGVALVWVISRVIGVPFGAHPWEPEPVTLLDGLATALEFGVLIVVLTHVRFGRTLGPWIATACILGASTATIAATEPHGHQVAGVDPQAIESAAFSTAQSDGEIVTTPLFGGYAEGFLNRLKPGRNEVHVGFFTRSGNDLPIDAVQITFRAEGSPRQEAEPERLARSHFVAPVELEPGTWTFRVEAVTESGQAFVTEFEQQIKP